MNLIISRSDQHYMLHRSLDKHTDVTDVVEVSLLHYILYLM